MLGALMVRDRGENDHSAIVTFIEDMANTQVRKG
jgi:hypothetical protein